MESQAAGSEDVGLEAPLVGEYGQEYIQQQLSTTNQPELTLKAIQEKAGLQDPRCKPLLKLLDLLDVKRRDAHRHILQQATKDLQDRIKQMKPDNLLRLLEITFPFIGISGLSAIPLTILERLQPVPATFIKQLAVDRDLFWQLPPNVQRQAWELDRKLLHAHALPIISAYTYETATALRALDMDESLIIQGTAATSNRPLPQLPRRVLRSGSAALQRLTRMVGSSITVYKGIVELCVALCRDSEAAFVGMKEAAFCSLRSQLLMALHDLGESKLCAAEPCHKLAWTLDACLKERQVDDRRIKELENFFHPYRVIRPSRVPVRSGSAGSRHHHHKARDDDAESAGAPGAHRVEDPAQEVGQAALLLRDPSAFHLLLHQVIRRLEKVVDDQKVPKDDKGLVFITRLLQLAVGGRAMLRDRQYVLPEANKEYLTTLYPIIADLILEAELRDADDEAVEPSIDPSIVPLMINEELPRKLVQVYALERLAAGDLITGIAVLRVIASCISSLPEQAVSECAPFGLTLARRMAALHAEQKVTPDDELWTIAIDNILVPLVDSETEVHEEVLRLLLAVAPTLDILRLSNYLTATLGNSRRSRKRHKKRTLNEEMEAGVGSPGYGGGGGHGESTMMTGVSDWGGASGLLQAPSINNKSVDGVRGTYQLFLQKQPALNESIAPALFTYFDSIAQ